MNGTPKKTDSRLAIVAIFALCAAALALSYCFFTNHIWEDFFITFRHSQNLIQGNGLVYTPGERVHGFTSPLGVLLPALCYLLTGAQSYLKAIWLYRILCTIFFAWAGVLLLLSLYREKIKSELAYLFLAALFLFETKSVVYSVNGMETAFMLFFLAWFIYLNSNDISRHWLAAGVAWAGLMYSRPDSIIYIIAFSVSLIIFSSARRKAVFLTLLKTSGICALLYVPWFIWTWIYYGSPILHTVLAKAHLRSQMNWLLIYQYTFGPIYMRFSAQPSWIIILSYLLGVSASFYWFIPIKDRLGKTVSLTIFLLHFYLLSIRTSPWYFPPLAMMSLFVVVHGIFKLTDSALNKIFYKLVVTIPLLLISIGMMYMLVNTALQMRIQQKEVEDGNRTQIGLWLKDAVKKNERVYTEALGYIGYFSQAKMLDFPGLVSKEVVALRAAHKELNFYTLTDKLKPEWVVVRPFEAKELYTIDYFKENYKLVKIFSVYDRLLQYNSIPWPGYVLYDSEFLIFKKQ